MAIINNTRKAQHKQAQMLGVLGQEGEDSRTSVTFYKAIFQEVVLFESETWVKNPHIGQTL